MINQWISVESGLPNVEPNTISHFYQVLRKNGDICYAIYVHDLEDDVDSQYFSGIETINYHGCYSYENEYYEISDVTHYCPMPVMTKEVTA